MILSGSANDGAAGIREIKAAGGITIVQEPTEAGVDGMPRAAIATGAVDARVAPGTDRRRHLVRLAKQPFSRDEAADADPVDLPLLQPVFHLLRRASGVDFSNYKCRPSGDASSAGWRCTACMTRRSTSRCCRATPRSWRGSQEDLLIHVTSFFREPESFEALRDGASSPAPGQARSRAVRAHLGARLLDRRRGLLAGDGALRVPGRRAAARADPDLRHRRQRSDRSSRRERGSIPRASPPTSRPSGCAGSSPGSTAATGSTRTCATGACSRGRTSPAIRRSRSSTSSSAATSSST